MVHKQSDAVVNVGSGLAIGEPEGVCGGGPEGVCLGDLKGCRGGGPEGVKGDAQTRRPITTRLLTLLLLHPSPGAAGPPT